MLTNLRFGFLAAALAAGVLPAQAPTPAAAPSIKIGGRLQLHGYYFDNDAHPRADVGPGSDFLLRRVRLDARGQLTDRVSFFVQPAFDGARPNVVRLRDAYIDVRLSPVDSTLILRAGQMKRPFGRYELLSSTNLPSIERGAGRGLQRVSTTDVFIEHDFLSHDIGAALLVRAGDVVSVQLGVYNGAGESTPDVNDSKSFGARTTVAVTPRLSLGGAFFSHEGVVGADSAVRHDAFEVDAQWGAPGEPGLFVVADVMQGEALAAAERTMRGAQVVAAWHRRLAEAPGALLVAVEPALRVDVVDPDIDVAADEARLVSAVLGFYLSSRSQLRVAFEHQSFADDALPSIAGVRTALTIAF